MFKALGDLAIEMDRRQRHHIRVLARKLHSSKMSRLCTVKPQRHVDVAHTSPESSPLLFLTSPDASLMSLNPKFRSDPQGIHFKGHVWPLARVLGGLTWAASHPYALAAASGHMQLSEITNQQLDSTCFTC